MVGRYENQDENGRWYTRPVQFCENLHGKIFLISTSLLTLLLAPVGNKQTKQPTNVHPGRQPVLTSLNLRFRQKNHQFKQPTKQIL
jgi:hypothetical protein